MAEPLADRERYQPKQSQIELVTDPVVVLPGDWCPWCLEGPGFCVCPAMERRQRRA
jgi:hypothetical protein